VRLAQGAALIIVTHQLAEVWGFASRVAALIDGRWALDEPRAGPVEQFVSRYAALTGA
jgi:ABC-type sugar transport system ATPase subunit